MKQGSGRHPPPRGKPGAWLTNEAAEKMLGLAPKWPRRKTKMDTSRRRLTPTTDDNVTGCDRT